MGKGEEVRWGKGRKGGGERGGSEVEKGEEVRWGKGRMGEARWRGWDRSEGDETCCLKEWLPFQVDSSTDEIEAMQQRSTALEEKLSQTEGLVKRLQQETSFLERQHKEVLSEVGVPSDCTVPGPPFSHYPLGRTKAAAD